MNNSIRPILRVFWQHARQYKLAVFLIVFFHASVHIVETIVPLYYKKFFDVLASASTPTESVVQQLFFLIAVIAGLYGIVWLFRKLAYSSKQPHNSIKTRNHRNQKEQLLNNALGWCGSACEYIKKLFVVKRQDCLYNMYARVKKYNEKNRELILSRVLPKYA